MKKSQTLKPIITKDDYNILNAYLSGVTSVKAFDRTNAISLTEELNKAILVATDKLPMDVVRLNSRVKIKEGNKDKIIELTVVVPEKADIKERKISVFAPIGTALIGFKKGTKVQWQVPAGNKTFTIMDVCNEYA